VIFTFKGKHAVYEIIYDKKHGPISSEIKNTESGIYEIKSDNRIKFENCEDTNKNKNQN
jgi:hypothetical protein